MRECERCDGKGEIPYRNETGEILWFIEEKITCPDCKGKGVIDEE